MKKLSFFLFAAALVVATSCRNNAKPADAPAEAPATEAPAAPAEQPAAAPAAETPAPAEKK